MNILVSGNRGYVGSVLTKLLVEKGHTVTGFDTNYYKYCSLFQYSSRVKKQIYKDIRNISKVDLEGIDGIIHLAALSNDPLSEFDPNLTMEINYKATVRLGSLAKKNGIKRFVYASSQSMYGISKADMVFETSPLNPITTYAKSKIMSEHALADLADENFCPVFLRPSTVYGVSPMLRLDIVFNNLMAWAVTTGKIQIMSDGSPWRPVIHVEDISNAFIAALLAPCELVFKESFNVGERTNYRVRDMAEIIKNLLPKPCSIEYLSKHSPDERSYKINSDKFHTRLKKYYFPKWKLEKGVEQLYSTYRKYNLTYKKFVGNKYIRLNQLKKLIKEGRIDKKFYWTK